jgi:hypothetical protein
MLKGVQLPRRWPLGKNLPELKQNQTVTTELQLISAKDKMGSDTAWLARSDDDIWDMQPDSTIPRWHWVNLPHGCPIHGTEIYRKQAYYPWIVDLSWPWKWKIRCPIGGETYPSNDFAHDDMTSGVFPDDGKGCLYNGRKYFFIAPIAQAYSHQMLRVAPDCSQGYLATGDPRYVHKALVALCRLAVEYAYLATMTQHRHRNSVKQLESMGYALFNEGPFIPRSGMTVYGVNQPRYQWLHAEAYDRIFPVIDEDPDIIPFLQRKGFAISTHEDVRRFIEENLFAVWMQATMDGAFMSNEPRDQRGFATMAAVLNYKSGTDFMDWLYDREGAMRNFLTNAYFKDGAPFEATGWYNGIHVSEIASLIDSIERMRDLRPELYPISKYPSLWNRHRYHNIFDFSMDTVTINRSYPSIGDDGSYRDSPVFRQLPIRAWQSGDTQSFEHAYKYFRDPKFAWALVHQPGWQPASGFPYSQQEIAREAAHWPDDWNDKSSIHDGYGLAILRSGSGINKRALWIRYGKARGHAHDDVMDVGLQAYQGVLLSHLGYPRNWSGWESNWITHNVARQIPFQSMTGQAELFSHTDGVSVAEIHAQAFVDKVDGGEGYKIIKDNKQRRLTALIDIDGERFYGVDWYRFAGGNEHWWSFHAQEGEFTTSDLYPELQEKGTLAGLDVPYGDPTWLKTKGASFSENYGWRGPMFGFAYLYNVKHAKPQKPWFADWAIKGGEDLKLHLRLTMIDIDDMSVAICDGRSPAGASPYEMKWLLLNKKGPAPIHSQILALLEPYLVKPTIQKIESLELLNKKDSILATGCVLHLGEYTDTIFLSEDATKEHHTANGMRFASRFGLWREKDGRPVSMVLVGGTLLARGEFGIRLDHPEYRGRIIKVDRGMRKIVISPSLPDASALVGKQIFITSSNRRSTYKVLAAMPVNSGTELHLDTESLIGEGLVKGSEDLRVLTSTSFPLHRVRYYHGARLLNSDNSNEYRLTEVRDKEAALIDPDYHKGVAASKLASDFPIGSWFQVYDYGLGDEVVWPYTVSLTEVGPRLMRILAPIPVQITVPDAYRLVYSDSK